MLCLWWPLFLCILIYSGEDLILSYLEMAIKYMGFREGALISKTNKKYAYLVFKILESVYLSNRRKHIYSYVQIEDMNSVQPIYIERLYEGHRLCSIQNQKNVGCFCMPFCSSSIEWLSVFEFFPTKTKIMAIMVCVLWFAIF